MSSSDATALSSIADANKRVSKAFYSNLYNLIQDFRDDCDLTPAIKNDTPEEQAEKYSWPLF